MNPELRDPERMQPTDPKAAVVAKAEQVAEHIKAASEGLKELQKLMGLVPLGDLKPEVAAQAADLRVSAIEASSQLAMFGLLPIVIKVMYRNREEGR